MFLSMPRSLTELNQRLIEQQQNQLSGQSGLKTYELRE